MIDETFKSYRQETELLFVLILIKKKTKKKTKKKGN